MRVPQVAQGASADGVPPLQDSRTAGVDRADASHAAQTHDTERIAYIDGLRGVAIAWVLIHHAWGYHYLYFAMPSAPSVFDRIANAGAQGVSLFLVLSGFCLSYPLLLRRRAGAVDWFKPSVFFARRCLRILPPYYAALVLSIVFIAAIGKRASTLPDIGGTPGAGNVLAHIFLVQNFTSYSTLINGPFWSLALEWQWYWLFPVVLLVMVWAPRRVVVACFALALAWTVALHPLTARLTAMHLADVLGRGMLTARLFEFACGILAAQLVVDRRVPPRLLLVLGLAPIPFFVADSTFYNYHRWIEQPIFGIAFAALLLLGYRSTLLNRALSARPLVALGIMSYSVYLVHLPAVEAVDRFAPLPLRRSPLVMLVAVCCGLTVGAIFHLLVERRCMRRSTWHLVSPVLLPLFAWTDTLVTRWIPRAPSAHPPAPQVAGAVGSELLSAAQSESG